MNETTKNNTVDLIEVAVKPYEFRKLNSTDVFPMCKIIGKIGVNEFSACFEKDEIKKLISNASGGDTSNIVSVVGISVLLEIANVIFNNLPKCENEIFQLLAQTSDKTEEEIRAFDFVTFTEMVIDFIKKEEFPSFFKVVSKLFN
jgi:hypothetical protein